MTDAEDAVFEGISAPVVARGGADDNIQVLVRVRPPNARELGQAFPRPTPLPERPFLFPARATPPAPSA